MKQGVLPLLSGLAVGFLSGYNICKHFNSSSEENKKVVKESPAAHNKSSNPLATDSSGIPCLVTDIGGTNCRCVLFRDDLIIAELTFDTKKYTSLSHCLKTFLEGKNANDYPKVAVIGIAGPVENNSIQEMNNIPWPTFSGDELAQELGIEKCQVINDFTAVGYGILGLNDSDVVNMNPNTSEVSGMPKAVIGAGTGLGVGYLTSHDNQYEVWGAEGGHVDFAPKNQLQRDYADYIYSVKEQFPQFLPLEGITPEMSIAGIAIQHIYLFMKTKYPEKINAEFDKEYMAASPEERNKLFTLKGQKNEDELCRMGLDMWLEIYGQVAGDLALSLLPYGGVYIAGGIASKLEEYFLTSGKFIHGFTNKPTNAKSLCVKIPVYYIKSTDIGLDGAKILAKRLASNI